MRPRTRLLIAVAVVAFLAVSFELSRYLTSPGVERDRVADLLRAQARGDERAMLAELDGCADSAACRAQVRANTTRLHRAGDPKILSLTSDTAYTLSSSTGPTRVAWAIVADDGPAVVQCVTVRREWSFLAGASVSLRRLSGPIGNEASC